MNPLFKDIPVLSREEEGRLIDLYVATGDMEAAGVLVHAKAKWMMNVIKKMGIPSWVNVDDVLNDVILDVLSGMKGYDRSRGGSLNTFLYVIVTRSARRAARFQENGEAINHPDLLVDGEPECCDVVGVIRELFARVPHDELNEEGRMVVDRMIRGCTVREIASQMGWTRDRAARCVDRMRSHIAWRMVKAGKSAAPWISDDELHDLADKHESSSWSLFD